MFYQNSCQMKPNANGFSTDCAPSKTNTFCKVIIVSLFLDAFRHCGVVWVRWRMQTSPWSWRNNRYLATRRISQDVLWYSLRFKAACSNTLLTFRQQEVPSPRGPHRELCMQCLGPFEVEDTPWVVNMDANCLQMQQSKPPFYCAQCGCSKIRRTSKSSPVPRGRLVESKRM